MADNIHLPCGNDPMHLARCDSLYITENGLYDVHGYSVADVNVSGGGTLITKSITANGTYNATDDNANGYSQVIVNVGALPSAHGVEF